MVYRLDFLHFHSIKRKENSYHLNHIPEGKSDSENVFGWTDERIHIPAVGDSTTQAEGKNLRPGVTLMDLMILICS